MTILRHTRVLLSRGRFSSMLELGGVNQPKVDTTLDVGKNNKVQAIVLDFDLIIRTIDKQRNDDGISTSTILEKQNVHPQSSGTARSSNSSSILPDVDIVKNMAKLLNVQFGGEENNRKIKNGPRKTNDDDLSLLTRMSEADANVARKNDNDISSNIINDETNKVVKEFNPSALDIRSKYAAKLRSKVEGGLAGVELAKSRKEDALKQGDAAGHLAARSIAASTTVSKSGSKWMASTGTGSLCTFLSNRSMKIALIPLPGKIDSDEQRKTKENMELLARQLPHVKFDVLGLDNGIKCEDAKEILKHVTSKWEISSISTIVVSDRDDYLGSARDLGMFTCRLRRLNQPRGNVSTSYTVEDIKAVIDVVNELNGISYNTVFKQ